MAKFKFRLATLQRLREARRDQERASLAEAFRAEQILAEHGAAVAAEQEALRGLRRETSAARYLDVNRLLEAQRYEVVLKGRELEIARQKELLAVEIERRRQAVVEADREVRVLDKLKERHHSEHQREYQLKESKQLDEVALNRQARRVIKPVTNQSLSRANS